MHACMHAYIHTYIHTLYTVKHRTWPTITVFGMMYAMNTLIEVYAAIDIRRSTSLEIFISCLMVWLEPKHVGMDDVK